MPLWKRIWWLLKPAPLCCKHCGEPFTDAQSWDNQVHDLLNHCVELHPETLNKEEVCHTG